MREIIVRLARKSRPLGQDGGNDDLSLHRAVGRALPVLDRVAAELSLKPLSSFLSEDQDNVHDLVEDDDETDELLEKLLPVRWSQPADALPTVIGLLSRVQSGDPIEGVKNLNSLTAELLNLKTILEYAVGRRATFRFFCEF